MKNDQYDMWREIESKGKDSNSKKSIKDPLHHLQENYLNIKSRIAFSGVTNLYRFYGGLLSHKKFKNYLKTIDSYTLHKKSRVLNYNPSYSRYRRQQFQLDLVDTPKLAAMNDDFKYLLMSIDTLSRYAFYKPLKNKQSVTVLEAF